MKALGGNRLALHSAQREGGFPSLPRQAGNAIAAATRVLGAAIVGRAIRVPTEVQALRESLCATCDENLAGRCRKCGCGVRSQFIRKTHLATERCPLEPPKWSKYQDAGLKDQNF